MTRFTKFLIIFIIVINLIPYIVFALTGIGYEPFRLQARPTGPRGLFERVDYLFYAGVERFVIEKGRTPATFKELVDAKCFDPAKRNPDSILYIDHQRRQLCEFSFKTMKTITAMFNSNWK